MTPQICVSPTSYLSTTGQLRAILLCYHHPFSRNTCQHPWEKEKKLLNVLYGQDFMYVTYIQNSLARTGHMATLNHRVPRSEILSCAQNGGDPECLTFAWAPFPTSSSSSFLSFFFSQFNLHFNLHYV